MRWILALLLIVAACTTAEPPTDVTEQPAVPTAAPPTEVEPAETVTPEPEVSDVKAQLQELWMDSPEYMVTYSATSSFDGQTQTMEMTQYLKGEQLRSDVAVEGMETRTIVTDNVYVCMNQGSWLCYQSEYDSDLETELQEQLREDSEDALADMNVIKLPGKTVAGTVTDCFRITNEMGEVDYCLSAEGVPLYIRSSAEGTSTELTATEYSTTVAGNAFTLPADPQDLAAMYENMPQMG